MLSHNATILWIVDLNPFGHLFFKAMNAPCITIARNVEPTPESRLTAISSKQTSDVSDNKANERQEYVAQIIRKVAASVIANRSMATVSFAEGGIIPQTKLQETASSRWNLSSSRAIAETNKAWYTGAELLEVRQGVTARGCLDVFLLDETVTTHLKLEEALVHRAIKSKDLTRWSVDWHGRMLLYPYHEQGDGYVPAFTLDLAELKDKKSAKRLTELGLKDALDFDLQIDDWEREIVRKAGIQQESVIKLLQHRVALGLVQYPHTALYLIEHYNRLETRVFKKVNVRKFNRRWYEYLWPRDAHIVLAKEKILSPRLIRAARFVLGTKGHLSDDACLFLQPTSKTRRGWSSFSKQ